MFPSLFLHDIWLIYFIVLNGPMFHIVLSRLDFYNQHSGVFISYVPTVPDVTIVSYSLMASMITAHNLECYIVSNSYVPIVLHATIVLDSPTYYAYLFTL